MKVAFQDHHSFTQYHESCRAHKGVRRHHHRPGECHISTGLKIIGWLRCLSAEMQRMGKNEREFREEKMI